jgi:glycosyltransferase involved in cell wall biosynthesis
VEQAIEHRSGRHILIVDALTPEPTRDSGSLRLVNIMRLLREQGWRITFMADNRRASAANILQLGRLGVHVLCVPWAPALAPWLAKNGHTVDAVMLCRHYIAEPHLPLIRRIAPQARILFDTVDLHFLREQRAAEHEGSAAMARQANVSQQRELALIAAADATFVVSPVEHAMLRQRLPAARVELLSNVHEIHGRLGPFAGRSGLVFVGGFGHTPNVDAVHWLVGEIMPLIQAVRPDIVLHLVGDMPEVERARICRPGVSIHGRVEDLSPWMRDCRIAVAPLRFGAGVKGKVNMAMSYGLPVVATTIAAEGMRLNHGRDVLLADDAGAFAEAIIRLHDDEALWQTLSEGGLANVRAHFSFDAARETLRRTLA